MQGKVILVALISVVLTAQAWANGGLDQILSERQPGRHSMANLSPAENQALFAKYCIGDSQAPDVPQPNYSNEKVARVALRLSRTKDLSDQRLEEMAAKNLRDSLDASVFELKELMPQSSVAVQSALGSLIAELQKTSWSTGFAESLKAALSKAESSVSQELRPTVEALIVKLGATGTPFDLQKFKELTKSLETAVREALKPVDYVTILKNLDMLSQALTKASQQKDHSDLVSFLKRVSAELAKHQEDLYIESELGSLGRVIQGLESGVAEPETFEADVTVMTNLFSWVFDPEQTGKEDLRHFQKEMEDIRPSLVALNANSILEVLAAYRNLVEQDMKNGTSQAASGTWNLRQSLQYLSGSEGSEFENARKSVVADFSRFDSNSVLSSAQYLRTEAHTEEPSSLRYILSDLESKLESHPDMQVTSVRSVWKALQLEFSKTQSAELLQKLELARGQFDNLVVPASAEYYEAMSELDAVVSLSASGFEESVQKLINEVAKSTAVYRSLQTVSELIRNTKIERLQSQHFYFYGGVTRLYGLNKAQVPGEAPKGTRPVAHIYLTQLCGEYRDRATMIESKLNWIENLVILGDATPKSLQTFKIDVNKNVWAQIPADAYSRYISLSHEVWSAKDDSQDQYQSIGRHKSIDTTVDGFSICETKYMMSEYVGKDRGFDDWQSYSQGYRQYASKCSKHDLDHYYDFRGDSNFKHYSPESNGMIWYATSIAKACVSPTKARSSQTVFTDADCANYFTRPFESRYNAARAGLMAWLFRSDDHANVFRSQGEMVAIYPHTQGARAPFSFGFNHEDPSGELFDFMPEWLSLSKLWNQPDMGFNTLFGLNGEVSSEEGKEKAFELLRDAVDRHTDWYSSGYNDKNGTAKNQAYSPFVASSYEMSESDNFTSCGITVQCPDDGLKRWMFIFKVHKDNWYTPERLARGEPIDFNRMWIDETAFGDSNLANSEKAWDRLGSPMEEELDSILYLIHVDRDGSDHEH